MARDALRRALESQDEKALQTALNAGRVAGLSEDELGDAARSLAQLEERARALQELRDSVGSGDRGRVRSAIDDAIRVGLPDDFVNAARQALNEMNETEASKERTVEAKSRDEARCEDEDASVEQQSHRNDLELQAVSSHLGLPETQAECEPKFDIETRTEINDKASYMWKATSLDAMADNLIIDHLRTRLCKLHTSAAMALAACTRSPSIDSPHNDAALPKVDSSVLRAFAEQLQYNMSEQRAQQFMNNASQDGEMLVADFLRLFDKQKKGLSGPSSPETRQELAEGRVATTEDAR